MITKHVVSGLLASLLLKTPLLAGEAEDVLIDKIVEAYGGTELTGLSALEFTDHTKRLNFGQSASPDLVDIGHFQASVLIDFAKSRKSWRSASWSASGRYTQNQFFDGTSGYSLNHSKRTYSASRSLSYAAADRRLSYTLDTVLVHMLDQAREQAKLAGQDTLDGVMHHKIVFRPSGHPELTLYVHSETNLLSMATRPHWMQGEVHSYRFSNHQHIGALTYAGDTYVYNRSEPRTLTVSRQVTLNPEDKGLFEIPEGYTRDGGGLDFSEMTATEIGDGVYIAGQNWGFSLFVDEGDYYTAAGGYDRFPQRLEAVNQLTGIQKPVRYFVVSHHHMDHIGGVQEIADLGATFVVHTDHLSTVEQRLGRPLRDEERLLVSSAEYQLGRIHIVDIPTGHSSHNLGTHVRDESIMFTADLFFSRQAEGGVRASGGLLSALQAVDLKPETFVAAHSSRPLTYTHLEEAVASATEDICPPTWLLCVRK